MRVILQFLCSTIHMAPTLKGRVWSGWGLVDRYRQELNGQNVNS